MELMVRYSVNANIFGFKQSDFNKKLSEFSDRWQVIIRSLLDSHLGTYGVLNPLIVLYLMMISFKILLNVVPISTYSLINRGITVQS